MVKVRDAGGTDSNTGSTTGEKTVDISKFPFKFNPPTHPSIRHVVPDLSASSADYQASVDRIYDEKGGEYAADSWKAGGAFSTLRLGRIIMWDTALSYAMVKTGSRFGFRFLYNPTTLSGSVNVGTDFIPDPTSTIGGIMQSGLEQIQMQLLINRMPEVQGRAQPEDYLPLTVTGAEMKEMRERGTHYDIEHLYRVANGMHNTITRQGTGDIGILLPNPCELHLGPFRSRGALTTISTTDQMYSAEMVPMLSYVNITFSRYLTFNVDETNRGILASTGVVQQGGTSSTSTDTSSSSSSSSGGSTSGGSKTPMTGGQVEAVALGAGFNAHDARIATMIAWGESKWTPNAYNGTCCYGLWQINLDAANWPTRKKKYGLTEKTDVYDPKVNARIAYDLYKGSGNWTDWEVYTNTSSPVYYKKAPSW